MARLTTLEAALLAALAVGTVVAVLLVLALASPATFAAPNPSGTGQPGVECGDENAEVEPAGFLTDGFAHAETVYAGSGASADQPSSAHAVSQYDVACFQITSKS